MRILIVRLGAIGDAIQVAAAIWCYKKQYPDHRIEWIVSKSLIPLLQVMRVTDVLHGVDEGALLTGTWSTRAYKIIALNFKMISTVMASERVITVYVDRRYNLLTALGFYKKRASLSKGKERPNLINTRNKIYEYFRLLSGADADWQVDLRGAIRELGRNIEGCNEYEAARAKFGRSFNESVILVPGGAKNILRDDGLRRWPIERYRELAEHLVDLGYEVILIGGGNDRWASEHFSDINVTDFIGKTNLIELFYLLNSVKAVISHDTGPLHLTYLTKTPLIAIFGPTLANVFLPMARQNTKVLQAGNVIPCSPCYDGKNYANCRSAECMKYVSVEQVLGALTNLISDDKTLKLCDINSRPS